MKNTVKTRTNKLIENTKVGMVALGCEKNRIDAEVMLAALENEGCELCADESECDVIIVHTCTFIDKAKDESIENILHAAEQKKIGKCKKLIVTGCLAERYRSEILEAIPEVDVILGSKSFDKVVEAIKKPEKEVFEHYEPLSSVTPTGARVLTSPNYSVFLKIADGCSNHCSYCVIPSVRGEFMPRPFVDVVAEAEALAANGAVEINLIAQDTTAYPDLCKLIKRIAAIETVKWVRILYCRPEEISDELIDLMATEEKLVKYIDVPLQHASEHVLKLMNRSMSDSELSALVEKLRSRIPDVSLRTTFIAGFPHETEEDFEILCNFVKASRFNNLGVFTYSKEEGTKAGRMHGQIDQETKERRADIVMNIQMTLLESINDEFIGKTFDVLCEGYDEEKELYTGRTYFQAPDIDGRVYFSSDDPVEEGEFCKVTLNVYDTYDFYGKVCE
ncbi:MAG: 30S ribosomal protein S12 methylthiotransferase RimO [Ruminococcaceae bacterium]|nr:30S ribosomal protein S12 methylthiotransferase RimO [Oscillospiraceae bacterium]